MTEVAVVPGRGGVFEVSIDGDNIFSKKSEKRFPEDDEILSAVKEALA